MKANFRVTLDQGCGAIVFVVRINGDNVTVFNKVGDKTEIKWITDNAGELIATLPDAANPEDAAATLQHYCYDCATVEIIQPVKAA